MEIKDAETLKANLERDIAQLVYAFELSTGLKVVDVDTNSFRKPTDLPIVSVRARLR